MDKRNAGVTEYHVRPMPGAGWWEVAKFDGGKAPTWVYDVHDRWGCNCLGGKTHGHCKHRDLIEIHRHVPILHIRTYEYERNNWAWEEVILSNNPLAIPQRRSKGGRLLPTGREGTFRKKVRVHKTGGQG